MFYGKLLVEVSIGMNKKIVFFICSIFLFSIFFSCIVVSVPGTLIYSLSTSPHGINKPNSVAVDDTYLWVADMDDKAIYCYQRNSLSSYTFMSGKTIDISTYSDDLRGIAEYENSLFVVDKFDLNIYEFDKSTKSYLDTYNLVYGNTSVWYYPQGLAVDEDYFYVVYYNTPAYPDQSNAKTEIHQYSRDPFVFISRTNITEMYSGLKLGYGIATSHTYIYLTEYEDHLIYQFWKGNYTVIDDIPITHYSTSRALDWDNNTFFLADSGDDMVYVIEAFGEDEEEVEEEDILFFLYINSGVNNSITYTPIYFFNWTKGEDVSFYQLQIANDSGFTDIYVDIDDIDIVNYPVYYEEKGGYVEFTLPTIYRRSWHQDYYMRVRPGYDYVE